MGKKQRYERLSPRRNLDVCVGILMFGKYYIGSTFEIGEGGMRVSGTPRPKSEKHVLVTFRIPNDQITVLRGTVKYVQNDQHEAPWFGLQFGAIDAKIRRAIRSYVARKTVGEAEVERRRWEDISREREEAA